MCNRACLQAGTTVGLRLSLSMSSGICCAACAVHVLDGTANAIYYMRVHPMCMPAAGKARMD
jgi:hypothetical protein